MAHLSNMDTRGHVVVSRKQYILFYTCSLSILTSHHLDLPQTAMVLTPIRAEGLGIGLLVFSAYCERSINDFGQLSAKQRVKPSKTSSMHNISAKALAVEIWILVHPLPNGRKTQTLSTWIVSAATGAMHIPIYVEPGRSTLNRRY